MTGAGAAEFLGLPYGEISGDVLARAKIAAALPEVLTRLTCFKDGSFSVMLQSGGMTLTSNFGRKIAPKEMAAVAMFAPTDDWLDPEGIAVGEHQPE